MQKENQQVVKYSNDDWFQALIDDVKSLIVEKRFEIEETLIRTKHEVGRVITERGQEEGVNVAELVDIVAERTDVSERTIQQCVQFYKFDPELTVLDGGKNISWRKCLKRMQVQKPPKEECLHEETKTIVVCICCGDKIGDDGK